LAGIGAVRISGAAHSPFAAGLILNQMAYNAGRNTSVRTVPAKVPPIKVYASVPQKKLMPKEELWRPRQLEEKSGATSNCAAKYLQTR